jgi:hypothetical protein
MDARYVGQLLSNIYRPQFEPFDSYRLEWIGHVVSTEGADRPQQFHFQDAAKF